MDADGMKNACTTKVLTSSAIVTASTTKTRSSVQNGWLRVRPLRPSSDLLAAGAGTAPSGAATVSSSPVIRRVRDAGSLLGGGDLATLPDASRLAAQRAQVVELGPADTAAGDDLDLVDRGGVYREGALDADAVADLADGERLARTRPLAPDDDALEDLDPGAVALRHLDMHAQRVARPEARDIGADLGLLKLGDRGVHGCGSSVVITRTHAFALQSVWSVFAPAAHRVPCLPAPTPGETPGSGLLRGLGLLVCHILAANRKASLRQHLPIASAERAAGLAGLRPKEALHQVRAVLRGPLQRPVTTPSRDRRVIAGQQHGRDFLAPPDPRPRVGRSLDQARHGPAVAAAERVVGRGPGVAEHPGQQPPDGLGHDQHRGLAAGQDVVADADLVHVHPGPGLGHDPGVDALIPAAGEDQPGLGGVLRGQGLAERDARRSRH